MIPKTILFQRPILHAHLFAKPNKPTLCFIPGFRSNFISSKKSIVIYEYALRHGLGYVSWNHSEHGSVMDWYQDGLSLMTQLGLNDHYCIGASMGLWISLLLGPKTFSKGILGIGGGADFTERWLMTEVPEKERDNPDFVWRRPSLYDPNGYYEIPVSFLLDSRAALIMQKKLVIPCPVYLIHGVLDHDIPIDTAKALYQHLLSCSTTEKKVTLDQVVDGDHQLSRPEDLEFICHKIKQMLK